MSSYTWSTHVRSFIAIITPAATHSGYLVGDEGCGCRVCYDQWDSCGFHDPDQLRRPERLGISGLWSCQHYDGRSELHNLILPRSRSTHWSDGPSLVASPHVTGHVLRSLIVWMMVHAHLCHRHLSCHMLT